MEDGILRKAEMPKQKEPWTITAVHTNGKIRLHEEPNRNKQTPEEYNLFLKITKLEKRNYDRNRN